MSLKPSGPADHGRARSLWVLGHRVTLIPAGGRIAAVEVVTPPGVPGPPPHYHEDADESFFVISGRLGVMVGDSWVRLGPGERVNVARNTIHTFRNDGSDDVRTITAFEPQGFERFFVEYGVDVDEPEARQRSVSDEMISRVTAGCWQFGMILAPK